MHENDLILHLSEFFRYKLMFKLIIFLVFPCLFDFSAILIIFTHKCFRLKSLLIILISDIVNEYFNSLFLVESRVRDPISQLFFLFFETLILSLNLFILIWYLISSDLLYELNWFEGISFKIFADVSSFFYLKAHLF